MFVRSSPFKRDTFTYLTYRYIIPGLCGNVKFIRARINLFCLQILSDQLSHVWFIGSHCILYHHNGSMSSLFFRVGVFFETFNVTFLCHPDCMRGMADRVLRLLYMLSFFVVWYLVRAARCRQPIVGGYLGAWIVLLDFSRRSRALHLLLWSIIWYWMSNKLTLRGEKRHVSLGNVYY